MKRGLRPSGDLIPWTISEQFQDETFAQLSGARIVRIATHPNAQGRGYGSRAMEQLLKYYQGELVDMDNVKVDEAQQMKEVKSTTMDDKIKPRKHLQPIL